MKINRRSLLKAIGIGSAVAASGMLLADVSPIRALKPGKGITVNAGPKILAVFSVEDFPSPVNGVVTLDENTTYNIMNPIDMGEIGLTARNCTLNGHHKGAIFTFSAPLKLDIRSLDSFSRSYLSSSIKVINHA